MEALLLLLRGMLVALATVAALFFVRFYRRSRDRFFLFFAAAFTLLAVNWVAVSLLAPEHEARAWAFVVRLLAFLLILVGIVLKNLEKGR